MIPASVGIGIREQIQLAIAALKAQIKRPWRPQDTHPGFAPRIGFLPLPVRTEDNRAGILPLGSGMRGIEFDLLSNIRGDDLREWRGTQRRLVSLLHSQKRKQQYASRQL